MKINRDNYESYFLDFIEGRLPADDIDRLMAFLESNPDLEDLLIDFNNYVAEPQNQLSLDKKFLLKSLDDFTKIDEHNFDEFCVAWYENQLSPYSRKIFEEFLDLNPSKRVDYEIFGKVFLKPDLKWVYPNKSKLKKYTISNLGRMTYILTTVAASLLIIFYLFPLKNNHKTINNQVVAISSKVDTLSSSNRENISPILSNLKSVKSSVIKTTSGIPAGAVASLPLPASSPDSFHKEILNLTPIKAIDINNISFGLSSENRELAMIRGNEEKRDSKAYYPTLKEFALTNLNKLTGNNSALVGEKENLTFWDIARMSVSGLNKLTGSDIKIDRKLDKSGNLTAMHIESGNLAFSRSFSK